MKIFCDTNIVLEFLQQRHYADDVEQILNYAAANSVPLYLSSGSFYTITYITDVYLKKTAELTSEERLFRLREILLGILSDFTISPHSNRTLLAGISDESFVDLEDSYQAQAALHSECDVLLTINDKHFAGLLSSEQIHVMTPAQFIEQFI